MVDLLSNVYLRHGAFHIVTSHPEEWKDKLKDIMTGPTTTPKEGHPEPGDERVRVITPGESSAVLGLAAVRQKGVSVSLNSMSRRQMAEAGLQMFFNDDENGPESAFLAHYYHCM